MAFINDQNVCRSTDILETFVLNGYLWFTHCLFLCSDNIYTNTFSVFPEFFFFSVPVPICILLLWHFFLFKYHIHLSFCHHVTNYNLYTSMNSMQFSKLFLLPYFGFGVLSVIMLALSYNLAFSAFLHKLRTKH